MKQSKATIRLFLFTFAICFGLTFMSSANSLSKVNAATTTLENEVYENIVNTGKSESYYIITVPENGYITLSTKESSDTIYKLYNTSNSLLDSTTVTKNSDYKATFSVKKGTYRLGTYSTKSISYSFCYSFSTETFLDTNKTFSVYPASKKQTMYFKLTPKKTGYITMVSKNTACYITLCDKNKKAISSKDYINSAILNYNKVVYGVKKNETYYIKFNSLSPKVILKYSLTSVTDKSGYKKAKAFKLSSGKKVTGLIIASKRTADWYKFKLKNPKKVTITLTGSTNDKLSIQIYNSKGESILYSEPYVYGANFNRKIVSLNNLKTTTYYIKISRGNTKSSGFYTLKYK